MHSIQCSTSTFGSPSTSTQEDWLITPLHNSDHVTFNIEFMIRPMAKCRTSKINIPPKTWVLTERRQCDLNFAAESAQAALYSQHLTDFHLSNNSVSSLTEPNGKDTQECDFPLRLIFYKFIRTTAKKNHLLLVVNDSPNFCRPLDQYRIERGKGKII